MKIKTQDYGDYIGERMEFHCKSQILIEGRLEDVRGSLVILSDAEVTFPDSFLSKHESVLLDKGRVLFCCPAPADAAGMGNSSMLKLLYDESEPHDDD
jgi:hypothetical protein